MVFIIFIYYIAHSNVHNEIITQPMNTHVINQICAWRDITGKIGTDD